MDVSRRDTLIAIPAAAFAVATPAVALANTNDPIVLLYRRYVDALAAYERLQRPATDAFDKLGSMSAEFCEASILAGEAWDRMVATRQELLATSAKSPAGLLLFSGSVLTASRLRNGARPHLFGRGRHPIFLSEGSMRDRTSLYDARKVSGLVARLEPKPDGGARVVIWDGPDKGWVPSRGAIDAHELLTSPPATDAYMAELGIPIDDLPRRVD